MGTEEVIAFVMGNGVVGGLMIWLYVGLRQRHWEREDGCTKRERELFDRLIQADQRAHLAEKRLAEMSDPNDTLPF